MSTSLGCASVMVGLDLEGGMGMGSDMASHNTRVLASKTGGELAGLKL